MDPGHRSHRWFRSRQRRDSPSSRRLSLPDTRNTINFVAPPDIEALPPYSPSTVAQPPANSSLPNEPPPEYQPSSFPLPEPAAVLEAPPIDEPTPTPATPASQPHPEKTFTRAEEYRHLNDIFSRHPWRRIWGRQPKSFADALNAAALNGQEQIISELLDLGVQVRGNRHCALPTTTPIHEALRGPKPWLAVVFIDRIYQCGGSADELLESKDANGCTPLHIAAEVGETAIARSFIAFHGAEVDPMDGIGRTPLHMAARYGRAETIDMLLEYGANTALVSERLWDFDKLWLRDAEAARRGDLLGSYTLISKTMRGALERRREARELALGDAGLDIYQLSSAEQENKDPETQLNTPPGRTAASSSRASQPRSLRNTTASSSRPRPEIQPTLPRLPNLETLHPMSLVQDHRLALLYGSDEVEAAMRVLERRRARAGSTSAHATNTMLFSPEYAVWKGDCDTLLQESRLQKQKNAQETGNKLDFY